MKFFRDRPVIMIAIVIVVLIILAFATANSSQAVPGESFIGSVISPFQSIVTSVVNSITGWIEHIFSVDDEGAELIALRERVMQLESDASLINDLKLENERLRTIANYYDENPQLEMVTARVIGKSPGYWINTLVINIGRNKGIEKDMPVITPQGLVGRVLEVGANWSKVISIIDSQSSVGGIIERTRDNGIVRGTIQENNSDGLCAMYYLPFENDLVPGDKVLTSGLGGLFPKGIVIGEVIEVSRPKDEVERTAVIKPTAKLNNIEEVMVIKKVIEQVNP